MAHAIGTMNTTNTIHLSQKEYASLRMASMRGKFHYEFFQNMQGDVEFVFGKATAARRAFYKSLEKVVDFGATSAHEVFGESYLPNPAFE